MFDTSVMLDVYDDKRISISTSNVFRDKELIMKLPGSKYDTREHRFFAPLTWASCMAMRGIFGDRLEVGEKLNEWAWNERNLRIDPAMKLREAWDAEGAEELYPFQRAGVQFLAYARRAMLCDEMGTGKTIQMIRTLKELYERGENPFPVIVVAPNNMTLTWKKEINIWWPELTVSVLKGGLAAKRKALEVPAHVYVINWESVRTMSKLSGYGSVRLKRCVECDGTLADIPSNSRTRCEHCPKELNKSVWKTVIADEAHRMKDPKAKQTRAVWALRTAETQSVYGMTGTPIANAPHDFWSALHFIAPEEFPSRTKYIDRYCQTMFNPFGGLTITGLREDTKAELFSILDPRMRRMPKEAVLPFLPKKIYSNRYVEMSAKQQRAYRQMEEELISVLDEGVTVAVNPLVQLTRLSQFASAFAEMNDQGETVLTEPSNKIDALVELLDEMGDEPAVVFAQSRQLIDLAIKRMAKEGISHTMIVGGQTADEREAAKENFQAGRVRVILCTISAGGIGITLTRSGTAIFLQREWSMVNNQQAEDRVHRIGSEIHDKINIIDIISVDTVEDRQRVVLGNKLDRLEEVLRDRETLRRVLG